jgi:hypothetical protein
VTAYIKKISNQCNVPVQMEQVQDTGEYSSYFNCVFSCKRDLVLYEFSNKLIIFIHSR